MHPSFASGSETLASPQATYLVAADARSMTSPPTAFSAAPLPGVGPPARIGLPRLWTSPPHGLPTTSAGYPFPHTFFPLPGTTSSGSSLGPSLSAAAYLEKAEHGDPPSPPHSPKDAPQMDPPPQPTMRRPGSTGSALVESSRELAAMPSYYDPFT